MKPITLLSLVLVVMFNAVGCEGKLTKSVTLSQAGAGELDAICDLTLTGPSESYTQYGNYPRFGDVN